MGKKIQLFELAELIFYCDKDQLSTLTHEEIFLTQEKFKELLKVFTTDATHYTTNFIKKGGSPLPYGSFASMGRIGEYAVLYFVDSFSTPLLFILDTKLGVVKNHIDINTAKMLLNDVVYENVKINLLRPKTMDRLFKGIPNMASFIKQYQEALEEHNNKNDTTEREFFELQL